jgi:hypothetical protein
LPPAAGKSTLVSHVFNNERVHDLFSQILLLTEDGLKEQNSCAVSKYESTSDRNKALLLIIELSKDIDEDTWKKHIFNLSWWNCQR